MFYKPNANAEGRTGSTYYTYGDPGFDKTKGNGHWTYINWSWVQNGGREYPANKCNGGGMVRALARPGTVFQACKVEPIIGYSYGRDNKINGRVTAFYGRAITGPGEKGDAIFGWLPLCYQKNDGVIVPCVQRRAMGAESKTFSPPPAHASDDRMERMAWNLFSPRRGNVADDWRKRFDAEADVMGKVEMLTELARTDDAAAGKLLSDVGNGDGDERVREQAKLLMKFVAGDGK
jgi:hypothetical protein